jgi:hypothetical protein
LDQASTLLQVLSVQTAVEIVDGAKYDLKFQYQDGAYNPAAFASVLDVTFAGRETMTPNVTLPRPGKVSETFVFAFETFEDSAPEAVRLIIRPNGHSNILGSQADPYGDRTIIFGTGTEPLGSYTFSIGRLTVAFGSVSGISKLNPAIDLIHNAKYDFIFSVRDKVLNPAAISQISGVTFVWIDRCQV